MSSARLNANGHARADGIVWPFGTFKGQPLAAINSGYLNWVMQHHDTWDAALVADVGAELRRRERARRPPRVERVLRRWQPKLRRRYQGDPAALAILAEADGLLRAMLGTEEATDDGS
jgi:hypothetical protein